MKVLVVVALVALIHGSSAALLIKGPTKPVMAGDSVTLECVSTDPEVNVSQVHFEMFSKYLRDWFQIPSWGCFYNGKMSRTPDTVVLSISTANTYHQGPYRCVSDAENATAQDSSSDMLSFKVYYMGVPILTREGYTSYLGVPQDLKVRVGEDVALKCSASSEEKPTYTWQKEGSDWILPSSELTLRKVSAADEGEYTCVAEHGTVRSLSKKRTVKVTVLPDDAPWYQSSDGRLVLMTSAAAAVLLVFILSVSVFLCRRAKQINTSKGPIDDRSQKKPIYRGSAESLPTACGDKQPLV